MLAVSAYKSSVSEGRCLYVLFSMTIQTAVLIETLTFLGAEVRALDLYFFPCLNSHSSKGDLDLVQHILYPRPCRCCHRSSWCPSLRMERRNRGGVRMVP